MSIVAASPIAAAKGGSFLIEPRTPAEVFTPEDLTHEQRQIAATAAQFAREEIEPAADPVEAKEPGVMRGLLAKAAELGFTSVEIPEEYGGMGMDKVSATRGHGSYRGAGQFFDGIWGADGDRHAAPGLVRHGGTEAQVPAEAGQRRMGGGLRAFRSEFRLGRDEYPHARRRCRRTGATTS